MISLFFYYYREKEKNKKGEDKIKQFKFDKNSFEKDFKEIKIEDDSLFDNDEKYKKHMEESDKNLDEIFDVVQEVNHQLKK